MIISDPSPSRVQTSTESWIKNDCPGPQGVGGPGGRSSCGGGGRTAYMVRAIET